MSFVSFHSVNVKGTWPHLTEKNLQPGATITILIVLSYKHFKTAVLL